MTQNDKPVLIYATFPRGPLAEVVGRALVERRLAACVNILAGMTSIYRWEGALQRDDEIVMVVKTTAARAEAAMQEIERRHPYETPAMLVLPIDGGSRAFLSWIARECAGSD
ncbi:MAG: divalent-cation tolerance protein CutA [Pseudomonadota bacterium]